MEVSESSALDHGGGGGCRSVACWKTRKAKMDWQDESRSTRMQGKSLKLKKLKQPAMLPERTQERIYAHFERSLGRIGILELGAISSESSRPRSSDNGWKPTNKCERRLFNCFRRNRIGWCHKPKVSNPPNAKVKIYQTWMWLKVAICTFLRKLLIKELPRDRLLLARTTTLNIKSSQICQIMMCLPLK